MKRFPIPHTAGIVPQEHNVVTGQCAPCHYAAELHCDVFRKGIVFELSEQTSGRHVHLLLL